jgi:hypothetical protein
VLHSAFSSPSGGNCEKKEIGECFRLKRNPFYRVPLSFRKKWPFFLLYDDEFLQASLSPLILVRWDPLKLFVAGTTAAYPGHLLCLLEPNHIFTCSNNLKLNLLYYLCPTNMISLLSLFFLVAI